MKAGFIGYKNHAEKLKKIFEESCLVKQFLFFHPNKKLDGLNFTNKIEDLFGSDFIVIASPDWTHAKYLRLLRDYRGYVFCEKIPAMSHEDLSFIRERPSELVYFNFNYRKGYLYELLKEKSDKAIYISIKCGIGLALKKEYKNNWRGDIDKCPGGVLQLAGIHYIDILTLIFGYPEAFDVHFRNLSPHGCSFDNVFLRLSFKNGVISDLAFSYTSPCHFNIDIIDMESITRIEGARVVVRSPRESYNKEGRFVSPPIVFDKEIDLHRESLVKSVNYFLSVVKNKGKFDGISPDRNLMSTELFLKLIELRPKHKKVMG
ncbi:MAG: hypothetical protein HQ564_05505 [Candidatus Saganbacteria bacterium]|nr:hypothetical protein [Candidatus Saganbacteria bacterium]